VYRNPKEQQELALEMKFGETDNKKCFAFLFGTTEEGQKAGLSVCTIH
jgi:hypothetical protein